MISDTWLFDQIFLMLRAKQSSQMLNWLPIGSSFPHTRQRRMYWSLFSRISSAIRSQIALRSAVQSSGIPIRRRS